MNKTERLQVAIALMPTFLVQHRTTAHTQPTEAECAAKAAASALTAADALLAALAEKKEEKGE